MYMFILNEIVVCSFLPFTFLRFWGWKLSLFLSILCVTVGGKKSTQNKCFTIYFGHEDCMLEPAINTFGGPAKHTLFIHNDNIYKV